ncbi:MAG: HD domain-containing protein [bacterium]
MKKKASADLTRDTELLYEIGSFRHVQRTWKRFHNSDFANASEHTFRVMWTALLLAKHERKMGGAAKAVDEEKILKIAMAHDLAESRTGDVDYISRQYTQRDEEKGAYDMFNGTVFAAEVLPLLAEYEKRESMEAKIVKDADTLDVELELMEEHSRGNKVAERLMSLRKVAVFEKLFTESACQFWNKIHQTDPHDWHVNSSGNRFNSGDWKK